MPIIPQPSLARSVFVYFAVTLEGHIQYDDTHHDCREHGLCAEAETPLDPPEAVDTHRLGGYAHKKQIGQCQGIIFDNRVLQCGNDGYGRIEGVAEEKIAFTHTVSELATSISP